jgi:hypothetical protein
MKTKQNTTSQTQIQSDIKEVIRLHECIAKSEKESLAMKIDAGKILLSFKMEKNESGKKVISHGQWINWLKKTFTTIDVRTLQLYMELAKKNETLSFLENCENTNQAYQLLKSSKTPKNPPRPKVQFNKTMGQEVANRSFNEIREAKVNLNLSEWNVNEGQPETQDNEIRSRYVTMKNKMKSLLLNRQYHNVGSDDELAEKFVLILDSFFASIIRTNKPKSIVSPRRIGCPPMNPVETNQFFENQSVETVTVE